MRGMRLCLFLCAALLMPTMSNAQPYAYGTPAPEVTAANADWQARSEPIIVNGLIYFPTRAFRLFDAQVMAQAGVYNGVPVYADVTLEPFSIVYVPLSASNMRVYERRREGMLAGTTGSRTPSFPVEVASDTVLANTQRANALAFAAYGGAPTAALPPANPQAASSSAIGTVGTSASAPAASTDAPADRARPQHTRIESIPRPEPGSGVWLEFNGARWYADGSAVPFTPDRFEPIGAYRGFPVYRDKNSGRTQIWVSVVKGGPVAPYARR